MQGGRGTTGGDPYAALVLAIAERGDRAAFRLLFDHYAPRVKGYLARLGLDGGRAEELAQEVLVTVWRKAGSFDARRASVSTWIYRIARNRRIDLYRRDRTADLDPDEPSLQPPPMAGPHEDLDAGQQRRRIGEALMTLPEDQRDLVRRAIYDDLSHGEIAELTGIPLGTVKSRLRLAFGKLRAVLEEPA
ncbi:MAG: sigma-70 family RNA polymerase sigma factor [Caulobacteraceae bacterium]|nr:MAG: sigma-70 family RNA polymerase sigma factor [Caulobacteraceae bacterium]